jgi:hypothetical protein
MHGLRLKQIVRWRSLLGLTYGLGLKQTVRCGSSLVLKQIVCEAMPKAYTLPIA